MSYSSKKYLEYEESRLNNPDNPLQLGNGKVFKPLKKEPVIVDKYTQAENEHFERMKYDENYRYEWYEQDAARQDEYLKQNGA